MCYLINIMDNIIEEIKNWIINFVEIKAPIFGNIPVCPFAKKERINNKINYIITDLSNLDNIVEKINQNNFDEKSTLILIDTHNKISLKEKEYFEEEINRMCNTNWSVYCLANEDFNVDGFFTRTNKYPIIIVTLLTEVEKAEKGLWNTKYFSNWSEHNYKRLKVDKP
jgi:hypothetical protein